MTLLSKKNKRVNHVVAPRESEKILDFHQIKRIASA